MSRKANLAELAKFTDAEEQKAEILRKLGSLDFIPWLKPTEVLVAIYVAPEKTSGGIIRIDKSIEEDRWQGKVGLLLKMGEAAYKYDGSAVWEGPVPEIGDWVFMRVNDAWDIDLKGVACRIIESDLTKGGITDPTLIY